MFSKAWTLTFLLGVLGANGQQENIANLKDHLRELFAPIQIYRGGLHEGSSEIQDGEKDPSGHKEWLPRDCADIWYSGMKESGIYRIWPAGFEEMGSFEAYCDMTTDGGGWTVFQKRGEFGNTEDYFFRTWGDYKFGFGDLEQEFWLGNDRIFALTNQGSYELRLDLWDFDNRTVHAKYTKFWIENEDRQYTLKIDGYSGDAGDSLSQFSDTPFKTRDRKNEEIPSQGNCALQFKGAWWYRNCEGSIMSGMFRYETRQPFCALILKGQIAIRDCHASNLNGLNLGGHHESYSDGIAWETFKGHHYSLAATEMKIRPTKFQSRLEKSRITN